MTENKEQEQRQDRQGAGRHDVRPVEPVVALRDKVLADAGGNQAEVGVGQYQTRPHVAVVVRDKGDQKQRRQRRLTLWQQDGCGYFLQRLN